MIQSWMVIGTVTFLVAILSFAIAPRDVKWFARLTRPRWLVFEPLIPFVWTKYNLIPKMLRFVIGN